MNALARYQRTEKLANRFRQEDSSLSKDRTVVRSAPFFIIVAVLAVGVLGADCRKDATEKSASFADFGFTDQAGLEQDFVDRLNEAMAKASEWQADAYFMTVNIFLEKTNISTQFPPIAYFASENEGLKNDFSVSFSPDFKTISQTEALARQTGAGDFVYQEIEPGKWRIGYTEALKIAEANGGSQFRAEHQSVQIALDLYQKQETGLEWGVYYSEAAVVAPRDTFNIYLDANTGAVNSVRE